MLAISKSKPYIKKTWRYNQTELRQNNLMNVKDWYWETGYYGWVEEEFYERLCKHAFYQTKLPIAEYNNAIKAIILVNPIYKKEDLPVFVQEEMKAMEEAMLGQNTVCEYCLRTTKRNMNSIKNRHAKFNVDNNEYIRSCSYFGGKDVIVWDWKDRNIIHPLYRFIAWSLTKLLGYTDYTEAH